MKKSDVIELMRDMPEEIDVDELMHRLYLREKLEKAEAALAAGDVFTDEEVERMSEEWLR